MNAVIYGVTGQDGSYLAELLLSKGYKVIGVTRRTSTDNTSRIKHFLNRSKFQLVQGDITDYSSVFRIITENAPDEVYNLAAQSHVWTSFNQPMLTWDITGKGVLNVLEVIRNMPQDSRPKVYQASSSEMFGDQYNLDNNREKYQDEKTRFAPQSPYAIAKLAGHSAVSLYRRSYDLFACSGILFNHESERRGEFFVTRKITKWIADFYSWCEFQGLDQDPRHFTYDEDFIHSRRESFPKLRLGNLDAKRDWGHAEDYVRAMWMMLQHDTPNDYVIATGKTYSVKEFLIQAFKCINIVEYENYVKIDQSLFRPSEVPILRGLPNKAKRTIGWEPEISFEGLVKRMLDHDIQSSLRYKRDEKQTA